MDRAPLVIHPETPEEPVTVFMHRAAPIHMHRITRHDLQELSSPFSSISIILAPSCLSLFAAFLITALTVSLSDRAYASFLMLALGSGALTVAFAVTATRDVIMSRRRLNDVLASNSDESPERVRRVPGT